MDPLFKLQAGIGATMDPIFKLQATHEEEWPRCRWCGAPVRWHGNGSWISLNTEEACCEHQAANGPVWERQSDDLAVVRRIERQIHGGTQ